MQKKAVYDINEKNRKIGYKMKNIKDFSLEKLKEEFLLLGEKPYRAEQVFEWLYQKKATSTILIYCVSRNLKMVPKSFYLIY